MFELEISDLSTAVWLSAHWATHTISLLDPEVSFLTLPEARAGAALRRYHFHDIGPNDTISRLLTHPTLVTQAQIEDMLTFTQELTSIDKLLVHCHAGISRSTAVACGILCQHGLTPADAIKTVFSIRRQAFPNRYIISLLDNTLGLEGQLKQAIDEVIQKIKYFY